MMRQRTDKAEVESAKEKSQNKFSLGLLAQQIIIGLYSVDSDLFLF
jgi:hypothetical protein